MKIANMQTLFLIVRTSIYEILPLADVMGSFLVWDNCSIVYSSSNIINSSKVFYSHGTIDSYTCYFSSNLIWCSYCFWCTWLQNQSYCIFNKQYTKEERHSSISHWRFVYQRRGRSCRISSTWPRDQSRYSWVDGRCGYQRFVRVWGMERWNCRKRPYFDRLSMTSYKKTATNRSLNPQKSHPRWRLKYLSCYQNRIWFLGQILTSTS